MNSLFIKLLITGIDTKTLSFKGCISSNEKTVPLWNEDIIELSFLNKRLVFKNIYLNEFKNFTKYSTLTISIKDSSNNIKLNETLSIYELSTLNPLLEDIIIEDNDLLSFDFNSYTLTKNKSNNIIEKSNDLYKLFTFDNLNIKPLAFFNPTDSIERLIFDKLILK